MRKLKVLKRLLAFALIVSCILSSNVFTVFAQNSNTAEGDSPADVNTYFKANLFDYDRDVMNQITVDKVTADLQAAIDNGEIDETIAADKEEIIKRYPGLIFIDSTRIGTAAARYTYFDTELNKVVYARLKATDFYDYGSLKFNRNNSGVHNTNRRPGVSYQGLVESELSNGLPQFKVYAPDLFNENDNSNKQIYKDTDVQFQLTDDGYYLFDSCINKYRLTNGKVKVVETDLSKTGQGYGYIPFGEDDYHFGMDLSVDFMMPSDGKYNGRDCEFEFSGDDDVFVYIDGKLAIELGGMHGRSDAKINFAKQQVIYTNATNDNGQIKEAGRTVSFESLGINTNDDSTHNLKVFYIERGASESNCKIKFNMPTINDNEDIAGDYEFEKKDSVTGNPIAGAEFTLYEDSSLSCPIKTVQSDENGKVKFENLKTGEYYMKETKVPSGYKSSTVKTYRLTVAGNSAEELVFSLVDTATNQTVDNSVIYNVPNDKHIDIDKKATLVDWNQRIYEITLKADAYIPSLEDESLSTDANARSNQTLSGKVIDIIDNRFELTEESRSFLISDGAVITNNQDGTTTVMWEVNSLLGWERKFNIKAKDNYVGGNNISTNDPASRVIIESDSGEEEHAFPEPKVNVRINISAGEAEDTIFLGQSLEGYFTQQQLAALYDDSERDARDVCIQYKWKEAEGGVLVDKLGSLEQFGEYIRSLSPETNTTYFLQVYAAPNVSDDSQAALRAAAAMNRNEDDTVFTASMQSSDDTGKKFVRVTGIYHVYIVDGKITVNKTYDHNFLTGLIYSQDDIDAIEARQTAVFTVYRYAEDVSVEEIADGSASPIESYDITITGDGTQTITGLRAGMYKVVENTEWTWKYDASLHEANDNTTDGIFYIGKESPSASVVDSEVVSFENNIDSEMSKIYSDTTNILNIFLGE